MCEKPVPRSTGLVPNVTQLCCSTGIRKLCNSSHCCERCFHHVYELGLTLTPLADGEADKLSSLLLLPASAVSTAASLP